MATRRPKSRRKSIRFAIMFNRARSPERVVVHASGTGSRGPRVGRRSRLAGPGSDDGGRAGGVAARRGRGGRGGGCGGGDPPGQEDDELFAPLPREEGGGARRAAADDLLAVK